VRNDQLLLMDIRDAIDTILKYAPRGRGGLDADLPVQSLVLRYIQVIGEAANRVSQATRQDNPEVPWQRIAAMRHVLVHDYFRVDLDQVWNVVSAHLPPLRAQVDEILERMGPDRTA
jgi:uncharacterized protein with HEPN domain